MLLTQSEKLTLTINEIKISETEHKITADHDDNKYITTPEFNQKTLI